MIDIQKLAKLVGLKVLPEEEAGLQKDFQNILAMLEKLQEVDTSGVQLGNSHYMQLGQFGSDSQTMDHNLFFANMKHEVRNGQMVVKHKGRE